jgi:hypothetical protein
MVVSGGILAMLGLLDIGPKGIDVMQEDYLGKTNRMYELLGNRWPLVVVMGVYYGVYIGGFAISRWLAKYKGGRVGFERKQTTYQHQHNHS